MSPRLSRLGAHGTRVMLRSAGGTHWLAALGTSGQSIILTGIGGTPSTICASGSWIASALDGATWVTLTRAGALDSAFTLTSSMGKMDTIDDGSGAYVGAFSSAANAALYKFDAHGTTTGSLGTTSPYYTQAHGNGTNVVAWSGGNCARLAASTLTLDWNANVGANVFVGAVLDSTGNVYTLEYNGTTNIYRLTKYTTTGTFSWGKEWAGRPDLDIGALAISGSNLWVVTSMSTGFASGAFVSKFSTAGTLAWTTCVNDFHASSITVDAGGNCYFGRASGFTSLDGAGNLRWSRTLSTDLYGTGLLRVNDDALALAFVTTIIYPAGATASSIVGRVPLTGLGTGTYTLGGSPIVYAAGTVATTTDTLTISAYTYTPTITYTLTTFTATTPTTSSMSRDIAAVH